MENIVCAGKTMDGRIIIDVTSEEGQKNRYYLRGARCGLSWPSASSPAYYCLLGQSVIGNVTGKYPLLLLKEGHEQLPGTLFQKMADDMGTFYCREIYVDPSDKFRSYTVMFNQFRHRERNLQGLHLRPAPFFQSFSHGVFIIKEWIKDEALEISKESIVYNQLKTISAENLRENPEESFYAINGMRFVVGAFETSACSPPSRRVPPRPVSLEAWT
jgi:hypothetical protein